MSKNPYFEAPYPFPVAALPCPLENRPGLILLSEIQVDYVEEVIGKRTEIVTLANNHSPLVSEIDGDVRKLLTVLKFRVKDVPNPELDISANLIRQSTREKIPLYFFLLDSRKDGGEDALLLELHLPEMEPGQYEVEFFIKCYEPEMEAATKRDFRVR